MSTLAIEKQANSLSETLKENSNQELIPYFDALKELKLQRLPNNEMESSLFYLAKELGLNPESTKIEDLRKLFNNKKQETGIYWDGSNWKIYYNATLSKNWSLDKKTPAENVNTAISAFKDNSYNEFIFNNDSTTEEKDFSRKKSLSIAKILEIGKKGFEIIQREKIKFEAIKKALQEKKEKESDLMQSASLDRLKLQITINNVPRNALQNQNLFTLWSLVIASLQKKNGKPLDSTLITDIKNNIDKGDIISGINYLKSKFFEEDTQDFIGKELAQISNSKLHSIWWSQDDKSWVVQSKEQENKSGSTSYLIVQRDNKYYKKVGLLPDLIKELEGSEPLKNANNQYEQLKEYSKKDVPKLNEDLIKNIPFDFKWQSNSINASEIPFLAEKGENWQFYKLSSTSLIAYSEKNSKYAIYNKPEWKELKKEEAETYFKKNNPEVDKNLSDTQKQILSEVIKVNNNSNENDVLNSLNKIGLDSKKFFLNRKLNQIQEIEESLQFGFNSNFKNLPFLPFGSKQREKLAEKAAKNIIQQIKTKIAKLDAETIKGEPFLQIVVGVNGQIEKFEVTKQKKKESLKERFQRRSAETRSGLAQTLGSINPTEQLKVQSYIFKDTLGRIKKEIWAKNWQDYQEGKINIAVAIAKSLGQTVKHVFVDTPYRSVKFGVGGLLAFTGLSYWYAKKRQARRIANKEKGNTVDDIQYGIDQTKGFISRFGKFLKGFKLPGMKKPIFAGLIGSLGLGWLFPKQAEALKNKAAQVASPLTKRVKRIKERFSSSTAITELDKNNKDQFLNKPSNTRIKLKVGLNLKSNTKITIPAPDPSSINASRARMLSNTNADFYLPEGSYSINGKTRQQWLRHYYLDGKKIEWSKQDSENVKIPKGTILPKGTIISK